jgi:hypothetical protein
LSARSNKEEGNQESMSGRERNMVCVPWRGWGAFYRPKLEAQEVASGGHHRTQAGKGVKRGVGLACAAGCRVMVARPGMMREVEMVWFRGGQGRGRRWYCSDLGHVG